MATLSNTSFFSPRQISGCALWLDAADSNSVVRTGSSVSQWNDKSGNGYNASNAVSANQPLYVTSSSGNYLSFNGTSSQFLGFTNPNALVANTTFTIIFVEKRQNINANYILGGSATVNANLHTGYASETNIRFGFYGNDLDFSPFSSYNTSNEPTRLWAFDYNGSTRSIILNSSTLVSSNNSTNLSSWANGSIGNFRNAAYYTGNLYEMLIYKPSLSTNQRQQIEGYLAWKWGLQSNLPSTHPFYNYNPNVPNINLFTPTTVLTSPLQVSGCALWLDAGDSNSIVRTGNTVTQWNDKSGNLNHATPSNNPIYSGSNIDIINSGFFNGSINIASGALQTTAFTVAVTPNTFTSANRILSVSDGIGLDYNSPTGFQYSATGTSGVGVAFRAVGAFTTGAVAINTRFMCTSLAFSSGGFVFSYNGHFPNGATSNFGSNTNTSNTNTLSKYYIGVTNAGGNSYNTGQCWKGLMNEIIIFNRTLSQSEYQQVEGYLAWKWGLQSSLPTTHPFYNFNPSAPLLIQLATLPIVQSNTTLITMSPTQISGCSLWLDAADATSLFKDTAGTQPVTTNGDIVLRINDKSGNSRNVTCSGFNTNLYTTTQLNGNSSIRIPSYSGFATPSFIISAADRLTCFVVLQQTATFIGNAVFIDANSATTILLMRRESTYIRTVVSQITAGNIGNMLANIGNPNIYEMTFDGSTLTDYLNGSSTATATGTSGGNLTNSSVVNIGSTGMNGYLYEVILYSTTLPTAQRQQIEGYLAWKWGLQSNLPTSHPYYYNPLIPNLVLQSQLLSMTPSFSPLRFSGTSLWLDAADANSVITSGSAVTQWNDKSGNGKNATTTAATNFPQYSQSSLNNLGTVRFDGISGNGNILDIPVFDFGTSTRTAFFVMRNTGPVSGNASQPHWFYPVSGNGTNSLSFTSWISVNIQGTRVEISYSATFNTYLLICFRFGTTTGFEELFNNGTLVGSATKSLGGTSYANATSGYKLGRLTLDNTNPIYYFDGNIGEVLIYNTALTNSQRQQIEGYLAWKWGLQSNLPANHPYVLFPPS